MHVRAACIEPQRVGIAVAAFCLFQMAGDIGRIGRRPWMPIGLVQDLVEVA
jgi:hypothetical protein